MAQKSWNGLNDHKGPVNKSYTIMKYGKMFYSYHMVRTLAVVKISRFGCLFYDYHMVRTLTVVKINRFGCLRDINHSPKEKVCMEHQSLFSGKVRKILSISPLLN